MEIWNSVCFMADMMVNTMVLVLWWYRRYLWHNKIFCEVAPFDRVWHWTRISALSHDQCQHQCRNGVLEGMQLLNTQGPNFPGTWDESMRPYLLENHILPNHRGNRKTSAVALSILDSGICLIVSYLIANGYWFLAIMLNDWKDYYK